MVGVRRPVRLETGALKAWLRALEAGVVRGEGVRAPLDAPPGVVAEALREGTAGLREAVVARLAVTAVVAGVSRLEVHLEHPTLVDALVEALHAHPAHLTTLALTLGPRTPLTPALTLALPAMSGLTSLTLTPATTDNHLAALAAARPPLATLDVSYSIGVTDTGVMALVGVHEGFTIKDLVCGRVEGCGCPATTLTAINVWGTSVSTRGCVVALSTCPTLTALTCRWTGEALDLLVRGGRGGGEDALALTHLLVEDTPLPLLHDVARVCPKLTSVVWRRPQGPVSVGGVVDGLAALTALTLIQFMPALEPSLLPAPAPNLTHLHLCLLELRPVSLPDLADTCPALTHLTLEYATPTVPSPPPPPPPSRLESLRIVTPLTTGRVMGADVGVWAMVWARDATSLDLAHCSAFTDQHILHVLDQGALGQVEDLRLSGAAQVTDEALHAVLRCCPALRRLALKMLPKERLAQLESFKVHIRENNLDLELITYGWKF